MLKIPDARDESYYAQYEFSNASGRRIRSKIHDVARPTLSKASKGGPLPLRRGLRRVRFRMCVFDRQDVAEGVAFSHR